MMISAAGHPTLLTTDVKILWQMRTFSQSWSVRGTIKITKFADFENSQISTRIWELAYLIGLQTEFNSIIIL